MAAVDCIIRIDGAEFIRGLMCPSAARALFDQTVADTDLRNACGGTGYTLQVFKPRYNNYFRVCSVNIGGIN